MQTVTPPPKAISVSSAPKIELPTEPRWALSLARTLRARGVSSHTLSLASLASAALGAGALPIGVLAPGPAGTVALVFAAVFIQLRFVCTLVGGIVGRDRGERTDSGEVVDDLQDRLADTMILVAAGYSVASWAVGPFLGWTCAILAIMNSYIHLIGNAAPIPSDVEGLMSKVHRMAVITGACVAAAMIPPGWRQAVVGVALAAVAVGCAFNLWKRIPKLLDAVDPRL